MAGDAERPERMTTLHYSYDARGRLTCVSDDGDLAGVANVGAAPRCTYTYEYTVDRSVRFGRDSVAIKELDCTEMELRVRVRLDGGGTATWVFAAPAGHRAKDVERTDAPAWPIPLCSNLRVRLPWEGLVLTAIVDGLDRKTRYEVDKTAGAIRVIGPGGAKAVYPIDGKRRLLAEVNSETGGLEFRWEERSLGE